MVVSFGSDNLDVLYTVEFVALNFSGNMLK